MIFLKTLIRSHQIHPLFKLYIRNPSPHCDSTKTHLISSKFSYKSFIPTSIFQRPISSLSSQFQQEKVDTKPTNSENVKEKNKKAKRKSTKKVSTHRFNFVKSEDEIVSSETPKILFVEETNKKSKKPLDVLFKEAVGLSEKVQEIESQSEIENDNKELKKKLRILEVEVRGLRENGSEERENSKKVRVLKDVTKPKSLSSLFMVNKVGDYNERIVKQLPEVEKELVFKELSSDMALFANFLYKQGYFKKANFLKNDKFDVTCFENNYGRDFLKFAAEKFAMANPEVAQWLSRSDLKKVAAFGCPSVLRKNVFSAKALRTFYGIQEETVCKKCVLKQSCKYVNQSVWKKGAKTIDLAVVMRVIILYALDSVPPQLVVPEEIKNSVSRLLKEIEHLSEVPS